METSLSMELCSRRWWVEESAFFSSSPHSCFPPLQFLFHEARLSGAASSMAWFDYAMIGWTASRFVAAIGILNEPGGGSPSPLRFLGGTLTYFVGLALIAGFVLQHLL